MEIFEFAVNHSFLEGAGHPITIPKSQLPYQQLEAAGLDHKHVTAIFPRDERFAAEICHDDVTYGDHYQLRFSDSKRDLPSYLKLDDHLVVMLVKTAMQSYAVIEYRRWALLDSGYRLLAS